MSRLAGLGSRARAPGVGAAPYPGFHIPFTGDVFADSGCTEPATPAMSSGCEREFAFEFEPIETCPPFEQLVGVYRRRGPLETVYRIDATTGACIADSGGGHALERIPLSALARIDRVIE